MIYLGKDTIGINHQVENFEEISKKMSAISLACKEEILPEEIIIDCTNLRYLATPTDWSINSGLKKIILKNIQAFETSNNMGLSSDEGTVRLSLEANRGIETIDFCGKCYVKGQLYHFFNYWYDLKYILGELDFSYVSSWTYGSWFMGGAKIEQITFTPNSALTVSTLNFDQLTNINDATLISIANLCLMNPSDTRTLKLAPIKKTRCSTLIGDNNDGLFVANENGTLSLADFITNIKGWNLQ